VSFCPDRDSLSLSMDYLAASPSPFPSPSSSFVPPPIPGTHEFAVLSPHALRKKFANARKESDESKQVHSNLPSHNNNKSELAGNGVADLVFHFSVSPFGRPLTSSSSFTAHDGQRNSNNAHADDYATSIRTTATITTPESSFPRDSARTSGADTSDTPSESILPDLPAIPYP
jgi:hypothetical protein